MSAPSVLDYARSHGLALDHTAEDLSNSLPCPPLVMFEDEAELPEPDFSLFANELLEPKLQISQKGGILLAESIRDPPVVIDWDHFLPDRHRVRKLKIEEPVLVGDHQADFLRFQRETASHRNADQYLETCSLISSTSDQDLEKEWDDIQSGNAARRVENELADERCHTTKEALIHLSCLLKNNLTDETKDEIIKGFFPSCEKPRARSVTPTLVQEEHSPEPYVPSSPDLDFPLRSDEDVDLDNLLRQVEREMQETDQILSDRASDPSPQKLAATKHLLQAARTRPDVKNIYAETIFLSDAGTRQARKGPNSFGFDVPIVSSSSPIERTSDDTTITSPLHSTDPSPLSQQEQGFHASNTIAPLPADNPERDGPLHLSLTSEFLRLAEVARHEVAAMLEENKTFAAERLWKHPVPQLDDILIRAPWSDHQDNFLASKLDETTLVPFDEADSQKNEQLNWQPIPSHLMKLGLDDEIEDNGQLHKWLEPPKTVTKSEQLIYKEPGLRLLDTEDESDDELEEDSDLLTEMRMPPQATVPAKRLEHGFDPKFNLVIKKTCIPRVEDLDRLRPESSSTSSLGGFSISSALDTFLDLRGGKFKRVAVPESASGTKLELAEDPIQQTQSDENECVDSRCISASKRLPIPTDSTSGTVKVQPTAEQEVCQDATEDQPQLMKLDRCRTVVIETAILQSYASVVNFLETFGGDRLNIVYRDLNKIGRDHCVSAAPDMILNPTTALILTNLQALSQKGLPGQAAAGQNTVRSRVRNLVKEYHRVLVAITTPNPNPDGASLQAQVDAMATFTGFCASLCGEDTLAVTPLWVIPRPAARTIDEALNKMLWNLICRYAFPETDPTMGAQHVVDAVALTNEESPWEQFLRRAGLNPMAAQVVLESLRRQGTSEGEHARGWSLRELVQMLPEERRAMLTETLGSKMTERLDLVLDREWR
ncbi:hypothetical protein G647_07112 [Cladophialophora carrionii CBS 160.54]|uniref:Uncharacterized protein n=1 Tax=Cladophialophora carrionii CBS 160.54 TaxID=1279043 RepID=V9D1K2_9EURO|nr:uncharacterized protein G647_07112 [Cladophialophora carrionii CBS 160.54]ETI20770.1 hypothetical protein G647_07112 [Cladophialophora carrionii CBS 160.54]